jgi:hypothetical protein
MALGSINTLTETSTKSIPGVKGRPARKGDNFTAICHPIFYKNARALTSHIPMTLQGLLQG